MVRLMLQEGWAQDDVWVVMKSRCNDDVQHFRHDKTKYIQLDNLEAKLVAVARNSTQGKSVQSVQVKHKCSTQERDQKHNNIFPDATGFA
jgi:hypothetical protein